MPRNEIALVVGLMVAFWYVFAGPGLAEGVPRNPRAIARALGAFLAGFLVTWIVLRLLNF